MDNCTVRSVLELPAPLCSGSSFRYFKQPVKVMDDGSMEEVFACDTVEDIPADVLNVIAKLLEILEYFLALKVICKSWQMVPLENRYFPLLMFPEAAGDGRRELYSLAVEKILMNIEIPVVESSMEVKKKAKTMVYKYMPADVLGEIADKLEVLEDYVSFKGVCTAWRKVPSTKRSFKIPLLLLPEGVDGRRELYSLAKSDIIMVIEVPDGAKGRRCTEIGFGWLMALDPSGEVLLFNPFSSPITTIQPPSYKDFPNYETEFAEQRNLGIFFIGRGLLTSDPIEDENYILFLVIVGGGLGFWRQGDKVWTRIKSVPQNIVYKDGRLYVVSQTTEKNGVISEGLEVRDPQGSSFSRAQVVQPRYWHDFLKGWEPYVAFSTKGELLVILRQNEGILKLGVCNGATNFIVFRIDLEEDNYERVSYLDEDAIFLGDNGAVCVNLAEFVDVSDLDKDVWDFCDPNDADMDVLNVDMDVLNVDMDVLRPNRIYFTDDRDRYLISFKSGDPTGVDMGFFHYSLPAFKEHVTRFTAPVGRDGAFTNRTFHPPIWVFPNIYQTWFERKRLQGSPHSVPGSGGCKNLLTQKLVV